MTERYNRAFRQFIFGETLLVDKPMGTADLEKVISKASEAKESGRLPSQGHTIEVFSRLAKAWADPAYARRRQAVDILTKTTGLSREFISAVFDEFPKRFSGGALLKKIEGELGHPQILEEPVLQKSTGARLIARPAGLVLHVAAGNGFASSIESLVDGIVTKNINFVKMSTDDRDFPIIFAESVKEFDTGSVVSSRLAVLWWKGGDSASEALFKRSMDRIVFWGGQEALSSWQSGLGPETVLVKHGPKISFGVISKAGLEHVSMADLTDRVAFDVSVWEQRACNCPQVILVEKSVPAGTMDALLDSLNESLKKAACRIPVGDRSNDECVEILKARELACAKRIATGEAVRVIGPKACEWTIICEERPDSSELGLSPLNRTIVIKRYTSLGSILATLKGQSFYLQTCGYCLSAAELAQYASALSEHGVTRLCPFGVMAIPPVGAPHDGVYALRDLTRFTVIE